MEEYNAFKSKQVQWWRKYMKEYNAFKSNSEMQIKI